MVAYKGWYGMDILLLWFDDIAQVQPLPVEELLQSHAQHILLSRDFVRSLWNRDHEMILLPPLPKNRKDHFDFRTENDKRLILYTVLMNSYRIRIYHFTK